MSIQELATRIVSFCTTNLQAIKEPLNKITTFIISNELLLTPRWFLIGVFLSIPCNLIGYFVQILTIIAIATYAYTGQRVTRWRQVMTKIHDSVLESLAMARDEFIKMMLPWVLKTFAPNLGNVLTGASDFVSSIPGVGDFFSSSTPEQNFFQEMSGGAQDTSSNPAVSDVSKQSASEELRNDACTLGISVGTVVNLFIQLFHFFFHPEVLCNFVLTMIQIFFENPIVSTALYSVSVVFLSIVAVILLIYKYPSSLKDKTQ